MIESLIIYRAAGPMFWGGEDVQKNLYNSLPSNEYQVVVIDTFEPSWLKNTSPNALFVKSDPYNWLESLRALIVTSNEFGLKYMGMITFAEETVIQYSKCINALNLIGPSKNSISCTSANKILMKLKLRESGIPTPEFVFVDNMIQLKNNIINFGVFPCIIKPAIGGGSIGVYRVNNSYEIDLQINQLKNDIDNKVDITFVNKIPGFLIEKFIDGKVVSIDGIINGKAKIYGMTDTITSPPPYFYQEAAFSPPDLDYHLAHECQKVTIAALDSIGLNHSAFHCELIIDKHTQKPFVVELAGRCPGGYLPNLYLHTYNNNLIESIINVSIGKENQSFKDDYCCKSTEFSIAGSCVLYTTGKVNNTIPSNIYQSLDTLKEYCQLPIGASIDHIGFSIADGLFVGEKVQCMKDYKTFIEICKNTIC
ncbi:acetyl-CoA carboxylase biotin carboxylase subunit family protein [Candidatus Neomarinimicrobiota bacterium]